MLYEVITHDMKMPECRGRHNRRIVPNAAQVQVGTGAYKYIDDPVSAVKAGLGQGRSTVPIPSYNFV